MCFVPCVLLLLVVVNSSGDNVSAAAGAAVGEKRETKYLVHPRVCITLRTLFLLLLLLLLVRIFQRCCSALVV